MIPTDSIEEFTVETEPSKTYCLDIEKGAIEGLCDGRKAVEQAIYLALETERYEYVIYSTNYGSELEQLYGKPMSYAASQIKSIIKDSLIADDRIKNIYDFKIVRLDKNSLKIMFTAETVFGDINAERTVKI